MKKYLIKTTRVILFLTIVFIASSFFIHIVNAQSDSAPTDATACPSGTVLDPQLGCVAPSSQVANQLSQNVNPAAQPVTVTPNTPTGSTAGAQTGTSVQTRAGNLGYVPLEPIPGLSTNADGSSLVNGSLGNIVNAIFKILIIGGALFAVLMLTIGGVQYMVSGSAGEKTQGIKRAQAALWGILLIAGCWLILQTVNPELLDFNLTPCTDPATCVITGGGTATTNSTGAASNNNSTDPTNIYKDQASCAASGNVWQDISATCIPPITTTIYNAIFTGDQTQSSNLQITNLGDVVKDPTTNTPLTLPGSASNDQINQLQTTCTSSGAAQGKSASVQTIETNGTYTYECVAQ